MKNILSHTWSTSLASILLAFITWTCSDSGSEPPQPATITLTIETASASKLQSTIRNEAPLPGGTVDSIAIVRIRLILKNLKLRALNDSSIIFPQAKIVELKPPQQPLTLATTNPATKTYSALDVIFHRPPANASTLPEFSDASFTEFLEGAHYSLIIDGIAFAQNARANFTFKSKVEIQSRLFFSSPLKLTAGSQATIAIVVDAGKWFKDESSGLYLDPLDQENELTINTNIANSLNLK